MMKALRTAVCLLAAFGILAPARAKVRQLSPAMLQQRIAAWAEPHVSEDHHEGQYMRQGCRDANLEQLPDWKGLPVKVCTYTDTQFPKNPVKATAYLLFPSADQLASWIVNACVDAGRDDLTTCTGRLASRLWMASNAQFPVAGYVVEPAQDKKWKYPNESYCFLFRDGVSVTTASYPDTTHAVDKACGPPAAVFEAPVKAFSYGRPVSATRKSYTAAGGTGDLGDADLRSPQWAFAVGQAFRAGWRAERNLLFRAAVADLSACDGNIWTDERIPSSCQ
ncbi:hypothetical protein [Mesorhizobium qingshengii]|uniref:Uncharacterized protein n=1 Tax=Mesorhizobium qingshengii TaxID=1165689 RepID=A0A1G5XHU3_9HYPH|nr:hypothetical protein [Mesorhizobium qingshengii]SDA69534.1 hypothetical protein SAMN02927914_02227 [Mesorhizobium qingshengii]